MVGTFYSKPKPDKPEFVSVGFVGERRIPSCV